MVHSHHTHGNLQDRGQPRVRSWPIRGAVVAMVVEAKQDSGDSCSDGGSHIVYSMNGAGRVSMSLR